MFETICALISLVYITLAVCRTAISLSTKDKRKRCARIKNYKKGTFIATPRVALRRLAPLKYFLVFCRNMC